MYKVIFCLLMAVFTFPSFTKGEEQPEQLFTKGNQLYAKGNFKDAAISYAQLVDSGYRSAELYFNLANAYYKLDEVPNAILFYERAYKLSPGDEDILVNLQFANSKITDKIEAIPDFFLDKWWRGVVMFLSSNAWSVLGSLLMVVGFSLLTVYLFATLVRIKKVAFYSGVLSVILGLVGIFMASSQTRYFEVANHAIVFNSSVEVKSGPETSMKTLFVVHEGLKVRIQEREGSWIKVELPNGGIGWIESAKVKEI